MFSFKKLGDGFWSGSAGDEVGILYVGIRFNGEDSFNWWISGIPTVHSKSDEWAIVQGNERLLEEAKKEARRALEKLVAQMVTSLGMYR